MSISSFCQEGWHRPALSLFAKVSLVFSCKLPKTTRSQKFAFAQWSGAMKAPVGLLSDRTVLRSKMEGPCPDKFTFAQRSAAMKAPVGLLSDRTVLRSKMEGPRPDRFTLTWLDFCGNLFQQFKLHIYLEFQLGSRRSRSKFLTFLSLHSKPEPRPSRKGWSGSGCCVAIFYCQIRTAP